MAGINKVLAQDWAMGVNDFTLKEGIILNPNANGENDEPDFWAGDLKLTYKIEDDPMKNYLKLNGFLRPTSGEFLTREFKITGDDTYNIEKASDILYVARSLPSPITEYISDSSFKVLPAVADVLTKYDSRFTSNNLGGELICKVTSSGDVYYKAFSISGETISLRDIKDWETGETGATFEIATLAVGDSFQLINAYDVLPEGLELTTGYPTLGYVIKHVESSGSWVKFNKYDKPNRSATDKVLITYYPLSDFQPEYPYWSYMDRYGTYDVEENIDFPITTAQEAEIVDNFKKYLKPLITLTLVTQRPTILRRGQEVVFSASRYPQGIFKVIDNKVKTETEKGGKNNLSIKTQTITFASYKDNWARIIASLKNNNDINKAKLAEYKKQQTTETLRLTVTWGRVTPSLSVPDAPSNLVIVDYGIDYITVSWDAVPEASYYGVIVSENSDLSDPILQSSALDNDFTAENLEENTVYYFGIYSVNFAGESSQSIISQSTITLTETLLINSDHTGLIQLYLVETDGTWLQNLSSNSYYEYAGDFTYAGDKVAFSRIYSGTNEDIVIKDISDLGSSSEVRLTNTAGSYRSYDPSFNHDDSKILYTSEVSGTRLRTMNLDGTSNSSVAISTGSSTFQGRYSPDGQYLLYSRGGSPSYIERRNVDLSNTISPMHTAVVGNFVSRWSKDSTKISYAYLSSATYGLYKMNADGTGHTQLTSSNLGFSSEWSVDGSKIYYQYNNGTQYSLRRINADGTGNTDLIPVSGTRYIQPASVKEIIRPNIATRTGKYLFASNANSENGIFNGTLVGSATATGGSCTIPNDNTSYLQLPASLINIATELTITAKIKINTLHTSSGQWNTLFTAPRYNQADNFVLFYDAFNNRWTYRHSGSTDVNFSNSAVEDGNYHFICFQLKLGVGAYSKVFIDDMSSPISSGGNTLTLLDANRFLFGQDVDSWTGLTPAQISGLDTNQSWAGLIEYLNITTTILNTSQLNTLKTEAGL